MTDPRSLLWTTMCEFLPTHIDWLADSRPTTPSQNMWINASIVMHTASMTEGAIESVLRSKLRAETGLSWDAVLPTSSMTERLVSACDDQIRQAGGWNALKRTFSVVMGHSLSDAVSDDSLMNANSHLFKLRNAAIAHGRAINSISLGETDFEWESKNLEQVEQYLCERNLWTSSPLAPLPVPSQFFSDDVADHFFESAIHLLIRVDAPPTSQNSIRTGRTAETVRRIRQQIAANS